MKFDDIINKVLSESYGDPTKDYDQEGNPINLDNQVAKDNLGISPGDWGDAYQEVKGLVNQLLSYGLDKTILMGILQYAEEVGYTGESVDNLIKLIQLAGQLLSYGLHKTILMGVLQYVEEVGYTGKSVDNLIKLIRHFNEKGVQDS
jgi:hypothetical protein